MQINTWTPPARQNSLPSQHQTLSRMHFGPTRQMGFYGLQHQQSVRLNKPHIFSEPISSSANLQSNQSPEMWSNGIQTQLPASAKHSPPNIVHHASLQAGQARNFTVNHNHDSQVLNTSIQRTYTDLYSMQNASCTAPSFSVPSAPRNVNCVFDNSYYNWYGSVPQWQYPLNRQYNGVQNMQSKQAGLTAQTNHVALTVNMNQGERGVIGQQNQTPSSVANYPLASHIPVDSLLPSSSQMSQNQVQNRLCQPTPCTECDNYIELKHSSNQTTSLQYRARLNSAIQNQANQRLNKVSSRLTQEKLQSISSRHSKTHFATYSAIQSSSQPEVLQSKNTMSGLTMNYQDKSSFSTSTSQTSSPTSGSGSSKYSHRPLLRTLLEDNNSQLTSSSNSFGSQFAKSTSGSQQPIQDSTAGHITTGRNYTQGKIRKGKEYQGPSKETDISRGNEIRTGSHMAEPLKPSQDETNGKNGNEELQPVVDPADSLEVVKVVQQVNKAVAVVPPISQQASSHRQQNDVTTSTHDSLPLEINTVKNVSEECENMEIETNVQHVTCKPTEDLPQVPSSPNSSLRLGSKIDTSVDISGMRTSKNDPTAGSQSCNISQCDNGSLSTNQISNKCQDDVSIADFTSKSSVKQNDDQEVEFSSENTIFDLSTVPVVDYTLKDLKDLVKSLEVKSAERDKSTITDVGKCILDLYYDGNKQNLVKIGTLKELVKTASELCIKEMDAVVLQWLEPKHLKMLENCFQILRNETILPSADFRSSWLNVDGLPADVENVLAEPVSDYNLTLCKKLSQSVSQSVVDVVNSLVQIGADNTEDLGEHACNDIPKTTTDNIPEDICQSDPDYSEATFATTDCKTDMILEKGCVSGTPNKPTIIQKQFSQQQHDEADKLKENKPICTEPSFTISYDKCATNNSDVIDKIDFSDDVDSKNDLPEIMILSSEDARKLFSECSERDEKRESHQMSQEERKDLGTHCVKNHSDLSNVKATDDKFTCPHLTSLASDYFCSTCWNETPLLDIEDETLLSPKEGELNIDYQRQSCSPQSEKPIEYPCEPVCLESSCISKSITSTQKSDGSDVTRDPNPDDRTQSSSPPPAQKPDYEIEHTKNSSITKPVAKDHQNIVCSTETNTENLKMQDSDFPSGTKILTVMISPTRNSCDKNLKSPKTDTVPDADNNQFSPNVLIKNTSTHKQHPSDNRSPSRNDQHRYKNQESCNLPIKKRKLGTSSQMPNSSGTGKCKNTLPHKQKRPIISQSGQDEQSKERKKLRLELFGSNRRNTRSHNEDKSPLTPVYLTVSPSKNTGKNYKNEPSAKKKVYSQWSTTFTYPERSSSSYKKIEKHMEDQLKSKIQTLKRALEDRIKAILQKQSTVGLKHKQTEEDAAQESTKN